MYTKITAKINRILSNNKLQCIKIYIVSIVALLTMLAFSNHFIMLFIYLSPNNPLKTAMNKRITNYIEPIFRQNWHLFSPNPGVEFTRIEIQCKSLTASSGWFDPTFDIQNFHNKTRITGASKLLYLYRDLSDSLISEIRNAIPKCTSENENSCIAKLDISKIRNSISFSNINKFANQSCSKWSKSLANNANKSASFSHNIRLVKYKAISFSKSKDKKISRVVFNIPEIRAQ
jgi:hypothetical protein